MVLKSWIQETLNLLTDADSSTDVIPFYKALRGDDPQVEHLPRMDDPQVQSGTTLCF